MTQIDLVPVKPTTAIIGEADTDANHQRGRSIWFRLLINDRVAAVAACVLGLVFLTAIFGPMLVGELATSGRTIVMATHEMAFAREVADTVCFLDGGRIVESGSANQVLTDPRYDRTRQFLRRFTSGH